MQHRKLVRDNIPAIIIANGGTADFRVLTAEEYRTALHTKLAEESAELSAAPHGEQLSELADLMDVLKALAEDAGYSLEQVLNAATTKTENRGGFTRRIWLEESRD